MPAGAGSPGLADGPAHEDSVGARADGPVLGWIGPRPFTAAEADRLREAARFAAAPLAALTARATLTAALEAYLGRRSAARVLAGPLRRGVGETIRAALLYADLRGFTALSESQPPPAVIAALDAWFDRIAGAVHAFGGEVLKFIGDGVLAIFPVAAGRRAPPATRRCAPSPPREPAWRISTKRGGAGPAAAALRRGVASRRNSVGQYRRGRPAGLHRDRSCGQSGQPAGRALPAARPNGPDLGRRRRRNQRDADPAGNACAARHRHSMRRIHSPED